MDELNKKAVKPTVAILENVSRISAGNKEQTFTRLYRYLLRPDIYYLAYQNLYANNGASTKGVTDDTADGFSEKKILRIIESLKDGSYQPSPVRRTYIPKRNGKMRPLGIPTFTDKLVQEALRMILEAVYEPVFAETSHGFRPNRSCHTALRTISHSFTGIRWFIEGDMAERVRKLVEENARVRRDQAEYQKEYDALAAEHEKLSEKIQSVEDQKKDKADRRRRIEVFLRMLEKQEECVRFKPYAFVALVDRVVVGQDRKLEFIFRNGMKFEYTIVG